ncbi:hypothetical protein EDC01DRAFT_663569 [Geopyxis carbonaria]|nr:hypothetical protein EDC01DRAFT_663569 [Geopyxis carbonaria]
MMLDIFTLIAVGLADTATDMLTEKRTLERIFWVRVMFDNYKMPKFFPARWLLVKALDYAITNPDYVGKSKTEAKQKELEDKPQDRIEEIPDDKPQADHPIQEQK